MTDISKSLEAQINEFILRLKTRHIIGSYFIAKETAMILRQAISGTRWDDVDALIDFIRSLGKRLIAAQPKELAVGNIVRRVLKIIREVASGELSHRDTDQTTDSESYDEEKESAEGDDEATYTYTSTQDKPRKSVTEHHHWTMFNLLSDGPNLKTAAEQQRLLKEDMYALKPLIIQEINEEIIADLETVYKGIADQATDYIHANEVIMTIGKSRTVEEFLKRAAQKRRFQVIVTETSPSYQGHEMAKVLSEAGIDTTVIADSAIFAAMPRVNKVVVGSHTVLANGGLVAVSGTHLLAAAAKHHATPVLVCSALYKLSPLFAYDADTYNVTVSPHNVLAYQEGPTIDKVTISNPYFDYVEPALVSLFIHNLGSAPPTYVYRLLNDNYAQEDSFL